MISSWVNVFAVFIRRAIVKKEVVALLPTDLLNPINTNNLTTPHNDKIFFLNKVILKWAPLQTTFVKSSYKQADADFRIIAILAMIYQDKTN